MKIAIYAPYAKERLKQRVNIQFCIPEGIAGNSDVDRKGR
jgi:hypothetical protein